MSSELINRLAVYFEMAVIVLAAFAVAFWLGFVVWTFRDIRSRTRDPIAILLATLLSLAFGPVGTLLYLLLRPKETLAEQYDRALEEEALLREIEELNLCPGCRRPTKEDWVVCPYCHTPLRRPCPHCGRLVDLNWTVCPYCGQPIPEEEAETSQEVPAEVESQEETATAEPPLSEAEPSEVEPSEEAGEKGEELQEPSVQA